tara:strand:- start:1498 stop:3873 length:2376 start_codon:yes stop_codon:yes gene_type:complete
MKKSSLLILIFTVAISNKINAQNISQEKYQNQLIKEDFNQKVNNFKIVTTSDNYFILDNGDYFLSRNNNESEYAIFANNSEISDFILKTAIRIGPSSNKKASIGLILKAQKNAKGAIIFEINKQKEYRIKQLIENKYQILSGNSKKDGWVKTKLLNGIDEINYLEIRSENNVYDIYINSNYLSTFFVPDYNSGSCGLIIGAATKARISYFYLNTKGIKDNNLSSNLLESSNINLNIEDLNKKIQILEDKNQQLNEFNNNIQQKLNIEIEQLRNSNLILENSINDKNQEIINLKNIINDINIKLELSSKSENEKIVKLQNKNKSLQELINNKENLINEFKNKINKIESKISDLSTLSAEIEKIKLLNIELNSNIKERDALIKKLNKKNKDFIKNIDKIKATINYLNDSLVNKNREVNIIQEKLEVCDLQHSKASQRYFDIELKYKKLVEEKTSLNTEIIKYKNQLLNINSVYENEKLKIDSLNNLLTSELNNKINKLDLMLANERNLKLDLVDNYTKDIKNKENQILELTNTKFVLSKELETNTIELDKLKTENTIIKTSKNSLKKNLEKSENSLKKIKKELDEKIKILEAKNKEITKSNIEANKNIEEYIKRNTTNKNKIEKQIKQIQNLSSQLNNTKNELNSAKKIQQKYYNANDSVSKLNTTIGDSLIALSEKNLKLKTKITELKNLFVDKNFEVNGIKSEDVLETKDNNYIKSKIAPNVFYTVKIGVYMKALSDDQLKNISQIWYEQTEDGSYVYYSGEFDNPIDAKNHLNDIKLLNFKNSYIVIKEE